MKLLTYKEVAHILNVSDRTVKNWTDQQNDPLPCIRLSKRCIRIDENELKDWIERRNKHNKKNTEKLFNASRILKTEVVSHAEI